MYGLWVATARVPVATAGGSENSASKRTIFATARVPVATAALPKIALASALF